MAHPKHSSVRVRYDTCCGYCGISEIDAGGALTVDHYEPVSAGGDDSAENLVYACIRCNQYKADYWPNAAAIAAGRIVLHPQRDDAAQHLRENTQTGLLEPLTPTGAFHITLLDLNRPQLILHRQRVWLRALNDNIRLSLAREVGDLRSELQAYAQYAAQLERMLGLRPE